MKKDQQKCNEKITGYDGILAVFYLIIIVMGVIMCVNHGLGGTLLHLITITLCVWGVFAVKIIKYRSNIKAHISEFIFVGVMCVFSVFTLIGTIA